MQIISEIKLHSIPANLRLPNVFWRIMDALNHIKNIKASIPTELKEYAHELPNLHILQQIQLKI